MLMGALLESARIAADGWYLRTALYSSMDSLMSQYHKEVWEKYHLFLLEYEDEGTGTGTLGIFKAVF